MRIQFICKKNECYNFVSYTRRSSGLYNSTRFIVESLQARGVHADIVEVVDNNDIDREVSRFKPNTVIIEALWVVPEKFDVLKPLHPNVKWFVHMHSGLPFLALEGVAMDWLSKYYCRGIGVIANSTETYDAFKCFINDVVFLPNVYISEPMRGLKKSNEFLDIACFGAVRPMKNHLFQALAAMKFAKSRGKKLRFHINASRIETGGEPVLKNLIQLFESQDGCELVRHRWYEPDEFLYYLRHHIDIGLQISMTETFNVVCADYVTAGIPVVVSDQVKWASSFCKCEAEDIDGAVSKMEWVYKSRSLVKLNQYLLIKNSEKAQNMWFDFVRSQSE